MDMVIRQLQDRLSRARARAEKAEKLLETAKSEVSDLQAAIRVLTSLEAGEADSKGDPRRVVATDAVAARQTNILQILPLGEENGKEPKVLHEFYQLQFPDDDLGLDVLRTTLWRMKIRRQEFKSPSGLWRVCSANGRYWKREAPENSTRDHAQIT